jgi:hypothetical protein
MNNKMDIDEFVELRSKCFRLLEVIAEEQMMIAKNIRDARNVRDFPLYLNKQSTRLAAFRDARSTLDTIIKNIDKYTDIESALKRIEDALNIKGE